MIKFYNTLGHKKEEFKPLKDKIVNMYVCGPTVYDYDHLGHGRTFIIFDCIRRFLESEGYKVKYLQNITDVGHLMGEVDNGEDKIEKKAREEKVDPFEIARFFEKAHFLDMAALNIANPDFSPRATDYIADFIKFIEKLIFKKHAYIIDGSVYFDVGSFGDYGKLSGRRVDELIAGERGEKDLKKKNPADFALWRKAEPNHLMQWDSPWGKGFPGWHIECSVMAQKFLGDTLDIHGGAVDLVFPHHENEIAQSEAANGKELARFWLHSGMLSINHQKMAKSLGNFITLKDVLKKYDSDTVRLAILKTHWRRPLDWEEKALEEAKKMAIRLRRARIEAQDVKTGYKTAIANALSDDFNTPKALSIIFEDLEKLGKSDFDYIEKVFGLKMKEGKKLTPEQEKMLTERDIAREKEDFKKADALRKELEKQGIIVEDTTEGTRVLTF
ncbi:cysteine--tRNA ligase [Candidatus Berkelbacteria bacterium RBG_13_40_8]|uniref:Cysteine--tRNA ligase n=1 Tax=Candidatus Berkelbacteria bacterium RBG_13_40_8 TaxID=1797467 RepID=A0A1F5DNM2_9BACT|nr:MAG: cysteine--tRNA ligase [Candidatus Berkelbacteria bacterium RBG_13_40_8]